MSISITGKVRSGLPPMEASLKRYVEETGKNVSDVLNRKGKDLSFRLYRGFKRHAPGKGAIASEAERRFSRGGGIRIRLSVLKRAARAVRGKRAASARGRRVTRTIGGVKRRLNWRQLAARQEIALRERGRNFLAVGFLFRDWNAKSKSGKSFARARTGKIGMAERELQGKQQHVRIISARGGMGEVDRRHRISTRAIAEANRDTAKYLDERQGRRVGRLIKRRYAA